MFPRILAPDDLEPVVEIEKAYASPWSPAMIAGELSLPGSIVLVIEDTEGRITGWCCARSVAGEAELLKIAVHPESRRAGVGETLLLHLEKVLIGHKVETLFLEVRSHNYPALLFYHKYGFTEVGQRRGYYLEPADDALIFKKELLHSGN